MIEAAHILYPKYYKIFANKRKEWFFFFFWRTWDHKTEQSLSSKKISDQAIIYNHPPPLSQTNPHNTTTQNNIKQAIVRSFPNQASNIIKRGTINWTKKELGRFIFYPDSINTLHRCETVTFAPTSTVTIGSAVHFLASPSSTAPQLVSVANRQMWTKSTSVTHHWAVRNSPHHLAPPQPIPF